MQVTVGVSGTGGGFERFCAGETDISNASRAIEDDEKAACEQKGVEYAEFQVANDALTVIVNSENDWATCLTTEELKKIWEPDSQVNNWNQVRPDFPDQELKLFGPGTDSGTFDYFTDAINGEEDASRTDYSPSEDDNVIVQGVSGEKGGLGYLGFSYYEENQDTLKAVEVDSGDGCVAPSAETAQDGTYTPLSRPLFVYVKTESLAKPEVEAFVQYLLDNADLDRRGGAVRSADGRAEAGGAERLRRGQGRLRLERIGDRDVLVATPAVSAERPEIRLSGKRIRWGEVLIKGLLALCALVSIATTTGIVVALLVPAIEFFREVSIVDYLTGTEWSPLFEPPSFGVIPLVVGTLS